MLVGLALTPSWIGALQIIRDIKQVDPNKVLRDNGMP